MNICSRTRWGAVLLLFFSVSALAAINGPQTAQLLNNRYQQTASTCAATQPAWYCNGVLVQTRLYTAGRTFWQHDVDATALGAEGFAYLRRDQGIRQLAHGNGVVLSDRFTAVGDGKTLDVLCAYPFDQKLTANRGSNGCALPGFAPADADLSSCAALGVTDSTGWLAHFQQSGTEPTRQCSLSSLAPGQFAASQQAHEALGNVWSSRPNLMVVSNWDASAPLSMPVQALFYDIHQSGSMLSAQKDQRDYFNATGDWLPVLRMDLNDSTGNVFGFNLQDQLYVGYTVAARMNQRYQDARPECQQNQPAHLCNGVLIRGADASNSFHAWNPSPNSVSRNGVSFSYVRADVGTTQLADVKGFTVKESSAPSSHPLTLRCSYPVNAGTSGIPDSCRASCEQQGIVTVEAWRTRYASSPGSSCAFAPTAAQFQLNIQVRTVLSAGNRAGWNELIIAAWPQNIPTQIPLETFFYSNVAGRSPAQFIQSDYFKTTGYFLPIVRLTLTQAHPFDYDPQDQLATGTPGLRSRSTED